MKRQTYLRKIILKPDSFNEAIQLLLSQHAALHAHQMADSEPWSFEDEIFDDLSEDQIRRIPHNKEHSIAWIIWHMARIEDVTMNMLVAGSPQIFTQGDWLDRIKIRSRDTGNLMSETGIKILSNSIDLEELRKYRLTVGRQTRKIIKKLQPADLKQKVDPIRISRIKERGAVVEAASDLLDYWSKRNIAGLLLMPATRHNLVHLNEAWRLKSTYY